MVTTKAAGLKCPAPLAGNKSERLDEAQRSAMSDLPNWTPPELPPEVATFDCTDFGNYCARGYNPNGISGSIRGVPIKHFTEGQWLCHTTTGSSGSGFIFRDASGRELGLAFKCSASVARELFKQRGELILQFAPINSSREACGNKMRKHDYEMP